VSLLLVGVFKSGGNRCPSRCSNSVSSPCPVSFRGVCSVPCCCFCSFCSFVLCFRRAVSAVRSVLCRCCLSKCRSGGNCCPRSCSVSMSSPCLVSFRGMCSVPFHCFCSFVPCCVLRAVRCAPCRSSRGPVFYRCRVGCRRCCSSWQIVVRRAGRRPWRLWCRCVLLLVVFLRSLLLSECSCRPVFLLLLKCCRVFVDVSYVNQFHVSLWFQGDLYPCLVSWASEEVVCVVAGEYCPVHVQPVSHCPLSACGPQCQQFHQVGCVWCVFVCEDE